MKTIEEFFNEIENSEALNDEFEAIKDVDALSEFLKKRDCGFTAEEYIKFVNNNAEGELADDAAEAAAGGAGLGTKPGTRVIYYTCTNNHCPESQRSKPYEVEISQMSKSRNCDVCGRAMQSSPVPLRFFGGRFKTKR